MPAILFSFLATKAGRLLAAALSGVVLLGLAYGKGRFDGAARCAERLADLRGALARARLVELDRQRRINDAALLEARRQAEDLAAGIEALNARLEENADAAAGDADRDACGLGAGGVRRLDTLR
ncbi:MAG TPA: hypothetical protein ENK15_05785 [Thermopetrobacter sp.]|nr:hypothetical protein [Thermopetrobacter sp.]